jgi:hypothetical protein
LHHDRLSGALLSVVATSPQAPATQGLQPKTIDTYARGVRRIGEYFSYRVDDFSEDDLVEYFTDLLASHSWSGVKLYMS